MRRGQRRNDATPRPLRQRAALVGAFPFNGFQHDRKEARVRPVDTTRRSCSAGLKRTAGTRLIPALVLFLLGGCSLAFVDGPSPSPSPSGNACTTSYAAPTLDLLGVPATLVLSFGFGGFERSLEAVAPDDDDTFGNLEKASLAASGALLVSGVYGLVQVGRCRGSRDPVGGPSPGFSRDLYRPEAQATSAIWRANGPDGGRSGGRTGGLRGVGRRK